MRFVINILLFLVLIGFCFYWFNDKNPDRFDPGQIPYVGSALAVVAEKYAEFRFYLDSGQGNLWDFLSSSDEVRQITDKFKKIYDVAQSVYQP